MPEQIIYGASRGEPCAIDRPCSLCLFSGYTVRQRPWVWRLDETIVWHPVLVMAYGGMC